MKFLCNFFNNSFKNIEIYIQIRTLYNQTCQAGFLDELHSQNTFERVTHF